MTVPCFQRQKCQWPKAQLGTQCDKYGCPTPWRKASKWQECCHPVTSVAAFGEGQSLAQPMLVFNHYVEGDDLELLVFSCFYPPTAEIPAMRHHAKYMQCRRLKPGPRLCWVSTLP